MTWGRVQTYNPTDPTMYCEWGDATPYSPNEDPFNMTDTDTTFPVLHQYLEHGEYTYMCRMANMVSNMSFTKNVTI